MYESVAKLPCGKVTVAKLLATVTHCYTKEIKNFFLRNLIDLVIFEENAKNITFMYRTILQGGSKT